MVGNRLATDLTDVTDDLSALDGEGFWAVVAPFDGVPVCARFASVRPAVPWPGQRWRGPRADQWTSSLDQAGLEAGVRAIRDASDPTRVAEDLRRSFASVGGEVAPGG